MDLSFADDRGYLFRALSDFIRVAKLIANDVHNHADPGANKSGGPFRLGTDKEFAVNPDPR